MNETLSAPQYSGWRHNQEPVTIKTTPIKLGSSNIEWYLPKPTLGPDSGILLPSTRLIDLPRINGMPSPIIGGRIVGRKREQQQPQPKAADIWEVYKSRTLVEQEFKIQREKGWQVISASEQIRQDLSVARAREYRVNAPPTLEDAKASIFSWVNRKKEALVSAFSQVDLERSIRGWMGRGGERLNKHYVALNRLFAPPAYGLSYRLVSY